MYVSITLFLKIAIYFILFIRASQPTAWNVFQLTQNCKAFARQGPGSRTSIEEKLTVYIEKLEKGRTTDIDVCDYWYDYEKMLPCLATLARYILCLLTTSGSTEKFVLTAGDIINTVQTHSDCAEAEKNNFLQI